MGEMTDKPFDFVKQDDGWVRLGETGSDAESRAAAIYYDAMGFCGCGDPDMVRDLITKLLTGGKPWEDGGPGRPCGIDEAAALVRESPEAAGLALLYMLDAWKFTEHGSSVNGSWLTERGKQVAEIFAVERIDPDDAENGDTPLDSRQQ